MLKRIGNVLIDINEILSVSKYNNHVLILFKNTSSKSYQEEELGLSYYGFLDKLEELNKKPIDFKDVLLMSMCNKHE